MNNERQVKYKKLEDDPVNKEAFLRQDIKVLQDRYKNSHSMLDDGIHKFSHALYTGKPNSIITVYASGTYFAEYGPYLDYTVEFINKLIKDTTAALYGVVPIVESLERQKKMWQQKLDDVNKAAIAFREEHASMVSKFTEFNITDAIDGEYAAMYVHDLYVLCTQPDSPGIYMGYKDYVNSPFVN